MATSVNEPVNPTVGLNGRKVTSAKVISVAGITVSAALPNRRSCSRGNLPMTAPKQKQLRTKQQATANCRRNCSHCPTGSVTSAIRSFALGGVLPNGNATHPHNSTMPARVSKSRPPRSSRRVDRGTAGLATAG
ncbi:hypothetical protein GCM10009681_45010 [Luedemannella helvata]|uniref:Uncharacterized protein n=1 Tax=Luedemannella helvata TaxID=349315 RepID=A0ABN2KXC1_9ACTN